MNYFRVLAAGAFLLVSISATAQVSVNLNVGTPPPWGPVGYTNERYYYLPDVESYYDVNSSMFIYSSNGVWVRRAYLPSRYRTYDLYGGPKIVIRDYRGDTPYTNFSDYRIKYAKGYKGGEVRTIGVRPAKVTVIQNRTVINGYSKNNGKGKGHDNGNSPKGNHGRGGGHGKRK